MKGLMEISIAPNPRTQEILSNVTIPQSLSLGNTAPHICCVLHIPQSKGYGMSAHSSGVTASKNEQWRVKCSEKHSIFTCSNPAFPKLITLLSVVFYNIPGNYDPMGNTLGNIDLHNITPYMINEFILKKEQEIHIAKNAGRDIRFLPVLYYTNVLGDAI